MSGGFVYPVVADGSDAGKHFLQVRDAMRRSRWTLTEIAMQTDRKRKMAEARLLKSEAALERATADAEAMRERAKRAEQEIAGMRRKVMLAERASKQYQKMAEETRKLCGSADNANASTCVICLCKPRLHAPPCGHMCMCVECSKEVKACPICRKAYKTTFAIYVS